jgi:hypothetical protein
MREIVSYEVSGIFGVNEIELTDQRVSMTTTRTHGTTGCASRGRDGASDHRQVVRALFDAVEKRKTHEVPHEFQGATAWVREVLK